MFEAGFVDIEHDDLGAFVEKPAGGGQADAGSCARDEYGFFFESVHSVSFDVGESGLIKFDPTVSQPRKSLFSVRASIDCEFL
ncbi:MAG: hypothetical protein ACXU84_12635 [Xanthobacteraceae bacterium]